MHRLSKLKNGINLITIPVKGTKAITVLALFPVGSRYETKKISGASHFVEHLMFKGTEKRPTSLDISRELDAVGADYNAFTNKDYTGYYIRVRSTQLKLAFDLLSDMLFHSSFDKEEIEKEKGVIVEELHMYEDNPTMAVDMMFDRLMFGDTPLGWDIGGSPQSVKSVTRDELYQYYRQVYRPDNMVLAVAGDVDTKKIKKLMPYFSDKKDNGIKAKIRKNNFKKNTWSKSKIPLAKRVEVGTRKVDQMHMIMGYPGICITDKNKYTLAVLLNILGGSMSSRLFVEVREKRGLAYMVRAGAGAFRDVGIVQIQAGLDPARFKEAVKVIKEELTKISTEFVSDKELREAKTNLAGRTTLAMEDYSAQAEMYAKQFWFYTKISTPEESIRKIRKVTKEQVKNLAKNLFKDDQMRLSVIGPLKKEQIIKSL